VHQLRIEIGPEGIESLRKEPREFVRATIREGKVVYSDVGVHLKGSVGSFRPIDEKPGLTLDFARFKSEQRFHGLRRIHLDNSVEDPSYCNEQLGSEIFRGVGVPALRVAHALVKLNDRQLGLYVFKEGFTEDFLAGYFKEVGGGLYEPVEGHDVNERLKRNSVQAPQRDRAALKALAEAALEPDLDRRWQGLEKTLDVDRFLTFMALEVMLCHRDGYCMARNNFRVYHDLDTGKIVFFPHGMDQLLGKAELPWMPQMAGLVARSIIETTQGKERYKERFASLFKKMFQVSLLTNRVDQIATELRPFLSSREFRNLRAEATAVQERIIERQRQLTWQLSQPERQLLGFSNGIARLDGWIKIAEPVGGKMDQTKCADGTPALHIVAAANTCASWRANVLLNPGRYQFVGRAKVLGVKPLPFGVHQGAGLRVGGSTREGAGLIGNLPWQLLEAEFQVEKPTSEIECVCELRASAGEAWFDMESLQIKKLP
jgi:spore coat protein CotH